MTSKEARVVCSRTEMKKGWFDDFEDVLTPVPVGVAYKFGLVAAGMAESTFTPRPRASGTSAAASPSSRPQEGDAQIAPVRRTSSTARSLWLMASPSRMDTFTKPFSR